MLKRSPCTTAALLVLFLVTAPSSQGCLGAGPFRRPFLPARFEVAAFAVERGERGQPGSIESLKANIDAIDLVLDFGGIVGDDGTLVEHGSPDPRETRDIAIDNGRRLMLVVSNAVPGETGRTCMFETAHARAKTVQSLMAKVAGYDGLHLGFERMPARVKPLYSMFIRDLAKALHAQGKSLGVSIFPLVDMPSTTWGACDYTVIGKEADYVILCAYDRHDLATQPGAISPRMWVEAGLRKALIEIGPEKVLLGIGVHAYDWPESQGGAHNSPGPEGVLLAGTRQEGAEHGSAQHGGAQAPEYLSSEQALRRAEASGSVITFDGLSGQKTFRHRLEGLGRVVWLQDASSVKQGINLANKYGLRGVAIWRLGLEDALTWNVISSMRRRQHP
jgi:spore germination protein YaaH